MPDARAFALWNTPIRHARSTGLYQKEKYMMQAGTMPDSGIPRKNRAANSPAEFLHAAIVMTMVPQSTIATGKNFLAEKVFIKRLDGIKNKVTGK